MYILGVFSSHLPYMLLGLLYLVGLGTYSLQSVQDKNITMEHPAMHEIVQAYTPCTSIQSPKTCHFVQFVETIAVKPGLKTHISYLPVSNCDLLIRSFSVYYFFKPSFSLFSRPPPVV